jgi:uncharacterized protein YacL
MKLIRLIFFVLIVALSLIFFYFKDAGLNSVPFFVFVSLGIFFILIEYLSSKINTIYLTSFLLALLVSSVFSLISVKLFSFFNFGISVEVVAVLSFIAVFYLCFAAAFKLSETKLFSASGSKNELVVVDTSAIIDGRIADLCSTKFLSARFLVPKFVLKELQHIADSHDHLKRKRGRRGLDILSRMRKAKVDVVIDEHDFPDIREVDAKLVQLSKFYGASIFTTDYNLNKVAQLQGVTVLNINDLANALKPVVLPGENMKIKVVKEGKENKQAIGYLDDGTMVVVEDAKHLMGNVVNIAVTTVLQTSAGRIIFAKKAKR